MNYNELEKFANLLKMELKNKRLTKEELNQRIKIQDFTEEEYKKVVEIITVSGYILNGRKTLLESDNSEFLAYVDSMLKDIEDDK